MYSKITSKIRLMNVNRQMTITIAIKITDA